MLPWELRGYAPQISGIAQTNATVTISHNGRVIYQKKVPPCPFIVDDLNQSVQGTLDVKVTEEDGRVNSFQISAASTPFLTRQGQVRYKLAAGRPRASMSHHTENETFLSSEASGEFFPILHSMVVCSSPGMIITPGRWVSGKICSGWGRSRST